MARMEDFRSIEGWCNPRRRRSTSPPFPSSRSTGPRSNPLWRSQLTRPIFPPQVPLRYSAARQRSPLTPREEGGSSSSIHTSHLSTVLGAFHFSCFDKPAVMFTAFLHLALIPVARP